MAVDDVATSHYAAQAELARQAAAAGQQLWQRINPQAVLESWRSLVDKAVTALTAAQYAAAAAAQPYLAELAAAMGVQPAPVGEVDPAAFAGAAADGGDLASLLMMPAVRTVQLLAGGADDQMALLSGLAALTRVMATETADAGRVATSVAMTADRQFVTYVRHVELPACARCIILAGRQYTWSTGFQRHPRCDCTMVPMVYRPGEGYDTPAPASPEELFARMPEPDQIRAFGRAGAQAIRDGADMAQVVNARRGMTTAGGRSVTTEGTTSRGRAGRLLGQLRMRPGERYRRSQIPRLTPEQIYREAGGDRDEAIRLLERFGYLDRLSVRRRERAVAAAAGSPVAAADRTAQDAREAELQRQQAAERARRQAEQARRLAEEQARQKAEEERRAAQERARREAEERARREADRPRIGDLIPADTRNVSAEERARAQEGFYRVFTGTFAGLTVEPDGFALLRYAGNDQAVVTAVIKDATGVQVGTVERVFFRDVETGTLFVEHSLLTLSEGVRGQGFASEFNAYLERWYRQSGVERIQVHADIDVGGYTWARHGFDWANEETAALMFEGFEEFLEEHPNDPAADAARDILRRAQAEPFGSERYPTPYELSQVGRTPGATTWLGKSYMLGSDWQGVKWLR